MSFLRYFLGALAGALLAIIAMLSLAPAENDSSFRKAGRESLKSASSRVQRNPRDNSTNKSESEPDVTPEPKIPTPTERINIQRALNAEYSKILTDPRLFNALHYQTELQQKRAAATFIDLMGLNGNQKAELIKALADRQLAYLENDAALSSGGATVSSEASLAGLAAGDNATFKAQLVQVIGPEKAALYDAFQSHQKRWKEIAELRDSLDARGAPLNQAQINGLGKLVSTGSIFSDDIQDAIGSIVTDQQRTLLSQFSEKHAQLQIADDIDKRLREVIKQNWTSRGQR
jgi:hypothetical protein